MNEQEAEWGKEFERDGEEQVRWSVDRGFFPEPKRQFAFRWLGDEALARKAREQRTFDYVKRTFDYARWTFVAAVAAVLVGIAGIVTAVLLAHD
jgi:hypothetical protein